MRPAAPSSICNRSATDCFADLRGYPDSIAPIKRHRLNGADQYEAVGSAIP
jgi:hypothetical protein